MSQYHELGHFLDCHRNYHLCMKLKLMDQLHVRRARTCCLLERPWPLRSACLPHLHLKLQVPPHMDTLNNWPPTHCRMSGKQSRWSHPALPFPRETKKRLKQNCSPHRLSDELKHSRRTTKSSSKKHQRFCRKHNIYNRRQGAEEKRPESCFTSRDSTVTGSRRTKSAEFKKLGQDVLSEPNNSQLNSNLKNTFL